MADLSYILLEGLHNVFELFLKDRERKTLICLTQDQSE